MSKKRFLLGIFTQEDKAVEAIRELRCANVPIYDVFTPYAVHGLEDVMGIKRSRLPIVCFIAGLIGLVLALAFQTWVFTSSWPMNIGGKPHFALPAFIPVTFELTVLVGGLVSVAAFLIRSRLYPGASAYLVDAGVTDDKFVVAIHLKDASINADLVRVYLINSEADEVAEREVVI